MKVWEKPSIQGAIIGLGFAPHWLKNLKEISLPITKQSNRNCIVKTFGSLLKTAIKGKLFIDWFLVNVPCNGGNSIHAGILNTQMNKQNTAVNIAQVYATT